MQAAATPPRTELDLEDEDAEVLRQLQFIARNIWEDEDGETATLRAVPPRSPTDSVVSFAPATGSLYVESNRRLPPGAEPADRGRGLPDAAQEAALRRSGMSQAFAVLVQNLEPQTSEESLFSMFFPLGALTVEFIRSGTAGRKAALVYFPMKEVADNAATKLNSFVPHGQYQPLSVTSIPLEVARLLRASAAPPAGGEGRPAGTPPQAPLPSARRERPPRNVLGPTPKIVVGTTVISEGSSSSPPPPSAHAAPPPAHAAPPHAEQPSPPAQPATAPAKQRPPLPLHVAHPAKVEAVVWFPAPSGAGKLLRLIDQHEATDDSGIEPEQIMRLYAECPDAEDITTVLVRYMAKHQHRGIALLTAVLERFAEPKFAGLRGQVQQAVSRPLVRSLLSAQDKCERIGAAVVTAALFEFGFIAGTPFATARKLLETHPSRNDPDLVDALVSMTSAWRARRTERTTNDPDNDPDEAAFRTLVHRFYENTASAPASVSVTVGGVPLQHPSPPVKQPSDAFRPTQGGVDETPPRSASSLQSTPIRNAHNYSTDSESEALASTVYITRLPTTTSEAKLRQVFTEYGEINKVRLYDDAGGRGSFGFVEFTTPTAAAKMLNHCDRRQIDDATVRCNTARSAIHDVDPRDAIYDGTTRLRDCLFGVSPKPRNFPARRTS